jgi:SAM-dependent methyltransferase
VCGADDPRFLLESPGLDGPLVECRSCGLKYVGRRRSALTFGHGSGDTVDRLRAANVGFRHLRLEEEHRLARLNARWRLDLIRARRPSGRLIEVGSARGDFLAEAREFYDVSGVEPNPDLAAATPPGLQIHQGLVENAPWTGFDVAASFHVIEHVDSPSQFVSAIAQRLKPGGLLVLETPDIGSTPFRIMKRRWRQFIPEHYFFFDRRSLQRLFEKSGFTLERIDRIGKHASLNLIFNRLGRYWGPLGAMERAVSNSGLGRATMRLNPGDIMIAFATKR